MVNINDRVICLVGPSGVGKTTIAYRLAKLYDYNVIESFTTRPPRHENEKGHTHVEFFNEPSDNIIAHTYLNGFDYWSTKEQIIGQGVSLYAIEPKGVADLKVTFSKLEITIPIFVIFLHADYPTRKLRLLRDYYFLYDNPEDFESRVDNRIPIVDRRMNRDKDNFYVVDCNVAINANRVLSEVCEDVSMEISLFLESL